MGSQEYLSGPTGLQANWKRIRRSSALLESDVPRYWSKGRRNSSFPGSVGAWRVEPSVFRLKLVRSDGRVLVSKTSFLQANELFDVESVRRRISVRASQLADCRRRGKQRTAAPAPIAVYLGQVWRAISE